MQENLNFFFTIKKSKRVYYFLKLFLHMNGFNLKTKTL